MTSSEIAAESLRKFRKRKAKRKAMELWLLSQPVVMVVVPA